MSIATMLLFILLLLVSLACVFPRQAVALLAEFLRRLRLFVIAVEGRKSFHRIARQMHNWARREGIGRHVVEEHMQRHKASIIAENGRAAADVYLGKPSHRERYF